MGKSKYSAQDIAGILQGEGYDISKRTVNYYAFDKEMFKLKETGKNSFTEEELEKIKAIKLLQEYTAYTLEQIKEIINKHSLGEIRNLCASRATSLSSLPIKSFSAQRMASSQTSNYPKGAFIKGNEMLNGRNKTIKITENVTVNISDNYTKKQLEKLIDFIEKNEKE